jgi:uncharacterized caspase-like protein
MLLRRLRTWVIAALAVLLPLTGALAERRVALVVGNSAYRYVPSLTNPANDAQLMADTLAALGFDLVGGGVQLNLDKPGFDRAVQSFGQRLQGAEVGLFYYAGHGIQIRGGNYLVPVNANPRRESDIDFQMLDTRLVLRQMEDSGTQLNLVILDACRNNPFGGRGLRSASAGLAQMQAPEGTLISFATQPGNVAADGTGGHSPFTSALAATIRKPGLGLFEAFNNVGLEVKRTTGGSQQPWLSSSPIAGSFYFAGRATVADPTINAPAASTQGDVAELQARLKALEDRLKKENESRIAVATPPGQSVETSKPRTPSISLESLAQEFLDNYVYQAQGSRSNVLDYVKQTFASEVDYYGERMSSQKVLEDQQNYLTKWPRRSYRVRPGTDHITCDKTRSSCLVWGEFDFDVSNPGTSESSAGVATFEFRVNFTSNGPKVVFENGNVISRR